MGGRVPPEGDVRPFSMINPEQGEHGRTNRKRHFVSIVYKYRIISGGTSSASARNNEQRACKSQALVCKSTAGSRPRTDELVSPNPTSSLGQNVGPSFALLDEVKA